MGAERPSEQCQEQLSPGTGEMGFSACHTEQTAVPQSQFWMLWTWPRQLPALEPAQTYGEFFIAACVDDSLGGGGVVSLLNRCGDGGTMRVTEFSDCPGALAW